MTSEEERILAWTLLGEAGGEGLIGMSAVANVIRNRSVSGRYPANPASVALQESQFSTWNALSNGGNIPRARYPVESPAFTRALGVVRRVFSDNPGPDPTQGATHYYAPRGMPGEAAPYWWRSEARNGEKAIGNHIFAIKRANEDAPVPQVRSGGARDFSQSGLGRAPSQLDLQAFNAGGRNKLPDISGGGKTAAAPAPAPKPSNSISDRVRAAQSSGTKQPSKTIQSVAGFSVPQGTAGIAQVEAARSAVALTKPASQTKFAPSVPGPAPVKKTEEQLPEGDKEGITLRLGASDQARAAGRRAVAAAEAAKKQVAPVPMPPIQRPPPPQVAPRLAITVEGANTIYNTIGSGSSPKQESFFGSATGNSYVVGQTYQTGGGDRYVANSGGGFDRVNSDGSTSQRSGSGSGKRSYDADSNTWN